jgi:hypothetical protein
MNSVIIYICGDNPTNDSQVEEGFLPATRIDYTQMVLGIVRRGAGPHERLPKATHGGNQARVQSDQMVHVMAGGESGLKTLKTKLNLKEYNQARSNQVS